MNTYAQTRKRSSVANRTATPPQGKAAARPNLVPHAAEASAHRVDLPDAMRAKMENAFGADLSAVKLYESQAVADAGAKAVTQGSSIAFAPGMLDFTSFGGQSLLGHELSHVVSQARGEVSGGGFLNDHALEARADREGAMAAAGQQVAMPTASLSPVTAASAAGPMQAKKDKKKGEQDEEDIYGLRELFAEPQEPAKKVKDNGLVDATLGGADTLSEKVGNITEKFTDADTHKEFRQGIDDKIATAKKVETTVGKVFGNKKMQEGSLSGKAGEKVNGVIDKITGNEKAMKALETTGTVADLTNSSVGGLTSVMDFGAKSKALNKAKEYGTKSDVANASFDMAGSGLGVLKSGASLTKSIAGTVGTTAAKTAASVAGKVTKGLGLGIDAIGLGKDAYNFGHESIRKHKMSKSAKALEEKKKKGELSDQEKKQLSIFNQTKGAAGLNQKRAGFSGASHAIKMIGDVAAFTGTPVGAGIAGATTALGGAVDFVGNEVTDYEKDKFHKKTVKGDLDIKAQKKEFEEAKKGDLKAFSGVSKKAYQKALLRAQGYKSGSIDEAFEGETGKKADQIMEALENNEPWAIKYCKDNGINPEKAKKSDKHKAAVRKSIAKAMGGMENEDQEFHDSDMLAYDSFKGKADQNEKDTQERKEKGFWKYWGGKIGGGIKNVAKGSWESVKTAGGKVASAGKAVGKGIAKGAKAIGSGVATAAGGVKDFFTNKETRDKVWDSVKAAPGKAWEGVKSGAGKAWDGIKSGAGKIGGGIKSAAGGVKDFFTKKETRQKAWESLKAAPGKAWEGIKTGASKVGHGIVNAGKYAGNVVKHSVKKRVNAVKDWYQEGVDQMNLHKDSYDKMGGLDRFLWSAKNLPARMFHGTKGNKQATLDRVAESRNADAAVQAMMERKKKPEEQAG